MAQCSGEGGNHATRIWTANCAPTWEAEEQREKGLAPEEAGYAARRAFGNPTLSKEKTRETWDWVWLERFAQDLRYASRQIKKTPGFAIVVIVTFALGVGANSALFTVTNAVLLKMLPVHDPQHGAHWGCQSKTW